MLLFAVCLCFSRYAAVTYNYVVELVRNLGLGDYWWDLAPAVMWAVTPVKNDEKKNIIKCMVVSHMK